MTFFKKIWSWLLILGLFGSVFAVNPSYNFVPESGSQLKLHCNYVGNLSLLASWLNYNAFESTISFDSANIDLTHSTINSPFSKTNEILLFEIYIKLMVLCHDDRKVQLM